MPCPVSPGIIGLSGEIDGTNGGTGFGPAGEEDANLDPEPARQHYLNSAGRLILETFYNFQLSFGWFNHPAKGQPDRNAIKKKLASCAEIHLYPCNTATGHPVAFKMMKEMANTFNVPVFGFDGSIYYHPTVRGNVIVSRLTTGVGATEKDALDHEDKGILHNDNRPQLKKYSPTTPAP